MFYPGNISDRQPEVSCVQNVSLGAFKQEPAAQLSIISGLLHLKVLSVARAWDRIAAVVLQLLYEIRMPLSGLDSHYRAGAVTRREQSDDKIFFLAGKQQKNSFQTTEVRRKNRPEQKVSTCRTSPDASSTREICVGLSSSRGTWKTWQTAWCQLWN